MTTTLLLDALKIFTFAFFVDVFWVLYILVVSQRKKMQSALVSVLMGAPGLFGVLGVIDNRIMAIPYLIGLGAGTYAGLILDDYLTKNYSKKNNEKSRT